MRSMRRLKTETQSKEKEVFLFQKWQQERLRQQYSPHMRRSPKTPRSALKRRSREQTEFLRNKIQEANEACQSGEFSKAVQLFSEILDIEPRNAILFCNRSAAYIRMNLFQAALSDSLKSIELDPDWYKGYYRQAIALQCMGRHAEALAAYASALAHDEKSQQLLQALVEASLKSKLQETLEPLFEQLDQSDISGKAFATVAIIGQELLTAEEFQPAITVLESSLQLGTEDLALKGSVYSALSSGYWKSGNVKRALHFMHQDLLTVESLNDNTGICRVHGNLGNAYFSQSMLTDAEHHHKMQLELALEQDDSVQAANALTSLGHVYVATADYEDALSNHKRSALLRQQNGETILEAKELGSVGTVYALMGDFENAIKCQEEHVRIFMDLNEMSEVCQAMSLLGGLYQNIHKYDLAVKTFKEMLRISQEIEDSEQQCRALSGLGGAFRTQANIKAAERCHDQQLKIAIEIESTELEARAQADLGLTFQQKGDHEKALEYQKAYLESCRKINDREGEGRAYGNIGNAYQSLGHYERAIKYHKLGLSAVKDLGDKHSEASLHGNIAVAYQSLNMLEEALKHYEKHLKLAVELKDLRSECVAESNLGNFHSSQEKFDEAVLHFENYLSVANKLNDKEEMCKATHTLAYAYYRLENYEESIEFYEENISLANDLDNRELLSLAYCNLGLAYLAMNDFEKAVRCQKLFLASAREKKNTLNVCRAYGNLGNIYMRMGDTEEGLRFFQEQVKTADKSSNTHLQADCYHELAKVLEAEGKSEEAALRYEKELSIRRQMDDKPALFYQALISYASMLEKANRLSEAYKCYCEMFQHAKQNGDLEQCKNVCQLMGRVNIKMGKYEKAVIAFRLQLECINDTVDDSIESGHVHVNISDCYKEMGNTENAIQHLLQYQQIATALQLPGEENNAYKKLSDIHIIQETYQEALMYSEKRLMCSQDLKDEDICDAYMNVASGHALLENYDSAVSYYEQLLKTARGASLLQYEYTAYKGLGDSYRSLEDYEKSMHSHQNALDKATAMNNLELQACSCNLLGDAYNKLGKTQEAIKYYKQSLKISKDIDSLTIQVQASGRLGKLYYLCNDTEEATTYLRSAVKCADELGDRNEQIKALYRLALGFYFDNDIQSSLLCFQRVIDLIEYVEGHTLATISVEAIKFIMAAYQMLQKVYVQTGQYTQALFVAEKANSVNLELLLKKAGIQANVRIPLYEKFLQRIKGITTNICFYSVAVGNLYCWILSPHEGFVKFWEKPLIEKYSENNLRTLDMDDIVLMSSQETYDKLDKYVEETRKSLDVETHGKTLSDRSQSFASNIEIIDRKQSRKSRIGRPVVMTNSLEGPNAPAYQFRYRRPGKPDHERRSSRNFNWFSEAPIEEMYKLFAENIDLFFNKLKEEGVIQQTSVDMKIVLPKELSLVPFGLLRGQTFSKYFNERYNLSYSPTLFWLLESKMDVSNENLEIDSESENIFVFGGGSSDMMSDEARNISRVFGSSPTVGNNIPKEEIEARLSSSVVCHLSTDVAWQTPSFVFPCKVITNDVVRSSGTFSSDPDIEDLDPDPRSGSPGLSDVYVTAKDLSELQFNASLFTFGISAQSSYSDPICPDGLHLMMTCLQMTGCKTLLSSLWPVPDNVRRYFLQGFYQLYNKGVSAFEACQQTIHAMQTSDEFQHPSNWAGFIVYGQNSMLNRQIQSLTHALHEFLDNPNRDAIKVILHLVEKARQRLASDRRTSLYVAESSIMKKMQPGVIWKPILSSLGFRFEKANNNLPDSVFFPGMECQDILNNSSNTLYAFLGLSRNGLEAVAKLRAYPYIGTPLIKMLQEVLYYFNQDMSNVQVPFQLPLWRLPGCHEFLSSVGFDVMGIGKTEVMLRSGKISMRRPLQCALQVAKDLFEHLDDKTADKLMNATNKAYSEMQLRTTSTNGNMNSAVSKKTHSENVINYINTDATSMEMTGTLKRERSDLSDTSTNNFLNSDRGLFSSKDSQMNSSNEGGGAARKLRQRNQENANSMFGSKSDMKRYGTMEKLDVSDLVLAEGVQHSDDEGSDVWESSLHFSPDERERMVKSPDMFYEEDVEHFLENFRQNKKSINNKMASPRVTKQTLQKALSHGNSLDRKLEGSHATRDKSRARSTSAFSDSFLTESNESMKRFDSMSSEDSEHDYQIPKEYDRDDMFTPKEDQPKKMKVPHEWKRLQLTNDYFHNTALIKTSSIRETLSIDSGVCSPSLSDSGQLPQSKHVRESSGGFVDIDINSLDSKKSSPDTDRKSLENSDDYNDSKKKGWFTKRRNKNKKGKANSEDDASSDNIPKHNDKTKRYSVDMLSFLEVEKNKSSAAVEKKRSHRKSEGDINFNLKHSVNQQQLGTERGSNFLHPDYTRKLDSDVQMSLC